MASLSGSSSRVPDINPSKKTKTTPTATKTTQTSRCISFNEEEPVTNVSLDAFLPTASTPGQSTPLPTQLSHLVFTPGVTFEGQSVAQVVDVVAYMNQMQQRMADLPALVKEQQKTIDDLRANRSRNLGNVHEHGSQSALRSNQAPYNTR